MVTKNQLKVAEAVFAKNEKKPQYCNGLKNFIIHNCKLLNLSKEELLSKTDNEFAKELLNEFVFDIKMPWLVNDGYSHIANDDYDRLFSHKHIDQSLEKGLTIAKDLLLLHVEFEGI